MDNKRPSWDQYFMNMAKVAASRSSCSRRHVGAVIVKDKQVISTGYNGTPRGIKNCNEGGCPRCASTAKSGEDLAQCICSHAEENAIVQAAYHGVSVKDTTIYTTYCPCLLCAKMIINSGIKEVVFFEAYVFDDITKGLFEEVGIKFRVINE
jgi:dCMP deaminase